MKNFWNIYVIRKSKWLLLLILLKIFILITFFIIILYWIVKFSNTINSNWLTDTIIFMVYILSFFIYFNIIISLTSYFYDLIIIDNKSLYHFKLWLLFKENVYIIDLYMVQEVDSQIKWVTNVILNVWEVNIIELKDRITTFHFIDNPQEITNKIRELQYQYVDENQYKKNAENKMKWWKTIDNK